MKKKALLIGINYVGQDAELSGCVNDICDIRKICSLLGYTDICTLYDGKWVGTFPITDIRLANKSTAPTRQNMIDGMKWLVSDVNEGDMLFFHYSGHGGKLRELIRGSEIDRMDETIIPVDYLNAEMIRDNDLKTLLVEPLRGKNVSLRVILDCCHSGTGMDLFYNISPVLRRSADAIVEQPSYISQLISNAVQKELQKWFGSNVSMELEDSSPKFHEWSSDGIDEVVTLEQLEKREFHPRALQYVDVIMISGCMDKQTSADAYFSSRPNGALSFFLIAILQEKIQRNSWPSVANFLQDLQRRIRLGGFSQVPQMSCEFPISGYTRFTL